MFYRASGRRRQSRNRDLTDVVAAGDLEHWFAVAVKAANRLALRVLGSISVCGRVGAVVSFAGAGAD